MAVTNFKYHNIFVTTYYFCIIRSHQKYNLVQQTITFTDLRFDSAVHIPSGYL